MKMWNFVCVKQKTAYELRISDWRSDVCSSDLVRQTAAGAARTRLALAAEARVIKPRAKGAPFARQHHHPQPRGRLELVDGLRQRLPHRGVERVHLVGEDQPDVRTAEHNSELQSLMRIPYAVF